MSIPLLSLPEVFHTGKDAIFESQYASIIIREQRWNPSQGTGLAENYYGHNPILHFVLAFLSLTTGLSPFFITKYIFVIILRVAFVLAAYLLISTITNKKNNAFAYFATIIFMGGTRLMFMNVSRRFIAALFMILALYVIFKSQESPKKIWTVLFFFFSTLIIISDHSITYMFMIILFGMLLISKLPNIIGNIEFIANRNPLKKTWIILFLISLIAVIATLQPIFFAIILILLVLLLITQLRDLVHDIKFFRIHPVKIPDIFLKFSFVIVMWAVWNLIITKVLVKVDQSYMESLLRYIYSGKVADFLFGAGLTQGASVNINYVYENLIIYSSQFIFLILVAIGLFLFIKYLNDRKESKLVVVASANRALLMYLTMFSFIMYVLVGVLMLTSWAVIPQVSLWFFSLPISIFTAYSLYLFREKFFNKKFASVIILLTMLLLYTGGLLLGHVPTIVNRAPNEDIVVEFADSKNQQLYVSGLWLKNNSKTDSVVLGGPAVFDIYSGFFEFEVVTNDYARDFYLLGGAEYVNYFLQESHLFGYYRHTAKNHTIDYVVINNQLFEHPSFLVGDPLDPSIKKNFDKAHLDKTYDNQGIQIYHNYKANSK